MAGASVIYLAHVEILLTYVVVERGFSGVRCGVESDELAKFRLVVKAFEIGIPGRPGGVAVARGKGPLYGLQRLRLAAEHSVGASGVVERVGIIGAQRDRGF